MNILTEPISLLNHAVWVDTLDPSDIERRSQIEKETRERYYKSLDGVAKAEGKIESLRAEQNSVNQKLADVATRLADGVPSMAKELRLKNGGSFEECRSLEQDNNGWSLPPGVLYLGKLLAEHPDRFGRSILTTNFDPLIEVSIPYLYGMEFAAFYDTDGKLQVNGTRIEEHCWGEKRVESGFFRLPGSQMISAVIQNPTATISKFNRMGRLAGFGSKAVRMIRVGLAYNPTPHAALPMKYFRDVDAPGYTESWSEGLNIYHNPNARFPLDDSFFPHCMNHRQRGDQIAHTIPEFHPFTAETLIMSPDRRM